MVAGLVSAEVTSKVAEGMDLLTMKAECGPCGALQAVVDADTTAAEDSELSPPDSVTSAEVVPMDAVWVSAERSMMGGRGGDKGQVGV